MKNFPHQHNQLSKLRATLEIIRDLNDSGLDPRDDGVLGDELARRQIHRFRKFDYTIREGLDKRITAQLAIEHKKSKSNQGTRTAARENRKTLRHLGWLEVNNTQLTAAGTALLATEPESAEELAIAQPAVAQIATTDSANNLSHPVLHLLTLIDNIPFFESDGYDRMELALEAKDDSEEEYRRIAQLALMPKSDRYEYLFANGATLNKIDNAKKILPAFAMATKLMFIAGNGQYALTEVGKQFLKQEPASHVSPSMKESHNQSTIRVTTVSETTDPSQVGHSRQSSAATRRALSGAEQQASAALLFERTEQHQILVRNTAKHCGNRKFREDAASYDLLIESESNSPLDLIEAKTIDNDSRRQIRTAIGQLLDYEHLVVAPTFPNREIIKSIVVDKRIEQQLIEFLETLKIGLLLVSEENITPLNKTGQGTADRLQA